MLLDTCVNDKLRSRYNPEGSKLRHDQLVRVEVLSHFAEICKREKITWWLSSGTLLGAVRHGGFIPWDDDIDVVMMRKDFKRLKKVLMQESSSRFFFQCFETDYNYVNRFYKYRLKEGSLTLKNPRTLNYRCKGLGFDIFCIQPTSYMGARLSEIVYKQSVAKLYLIKSQWLRKVASTIVVRMMNAIVGCVHCLFYPFRKKGEYHYLCGTGWPKHTFDSKDIFPLGKMLFEGVLFPVPRDWDSYLRGAFGDYMQLPTEEQIKESIHAKEYRDEIWGNESN